MQRWLVAIFIAAISVVKASKITEIDSLVPPERALGNSIASLVAVVQANNNIDVKSLDASASSVQAGSIASLVAVVKGNNENMTVQHGIEVSQGPGPAPAPGPSAPASAPGTAPQSAPGLAPGPASLQVVAASPFGGEEEVRKTHMPAEGDAQFTKRLRGVDYYLLSASPPLKKAFKSAVKAILAAQVAGGLKPNDVTLKLSAGSVIINASFSNPQNLSALTQEKLRANLCSKEANLDAELLSAVSNLPGLKETTTNTLRFDKSPDCKTKKTAPTQETKPKAPPQKTPKALNISGRSLCDPPCMQQRGICGDGICFCEHPYTGRQCEERVQTESTRVNWMYVIPILFATGWLGMLLGEGLWKLCLGPTREPRGLPKTLGPGTTLVRHEVWRPQSWYSVKGSDWVAWI